MSKLQVGAQLYSIRDRCSNYEDMLSALKAIKAMGYNTCQVSGQSRDITFEQIRDILDEAELQCVCTHISYDDMVADLDQVIRNHKAIGCAYPGIGGLPERFRKGPDGYIAFAKEAGAIAEKLRDNGLTFIYHNHHFEFQRFDCCRKTGIELLLENAPDALQFELDVFWVQAAGASPLEWIEKVKGRMDIVHFKDMGYVSGSMFPMTPIGEGNINFAKIIEACDAIGVKHALVEQDNAVDTDSLKCMQVSHNNLKALGARF